MPNSGEFPIVKGQKFTFISLIASSSSLYYILSIFQGLHMFFSFLWQFLIPTGKLKWCSIYYLFNMIACCSLYIHICTHIYTYIYTCEYTYAYIWLHVYTCVICMHIYVYIQSVYVYLYVYLCLLSTSINRNTILLDQKIDLFIQRAIWAAVIFYAPVLLRAMQWEQHAIMHAGVAPKKMDSGIIKPGAYVG